MLASAHFNGPYKNNWGGEKNFTIAISANWSGMQLFPRSTSLFRKKTSHLRATRNTNLASRGTRARCGVTNLSVERKKGLRCSKISVHPHAPWNKDTCTRQSYPLFFPYIPFCSSHLLWSKAFPTHLLSPIRWLSNNFCYLVNRWESELNLFSKSRRLGWA